MRILIVKLSSIGDVVHTLPALAAVKRALPEARVSWVVEKGSAEILRGNPLLERLIEVDTRSLRRAGGSLGGALRSARAQIRDLRAAEFDLSIDFQGLFKSVSIARVSRSGRHYGFSRRNLREPASRFFLSETIEAEPVQNIVHKNIELAERSLRRHLRDEDFRLDREPLEFPVATSDEDRREAAEIADRAGGKFVLLNPAGGWPTKLWPAENYGALADRVRVELGLAPVVTTAPDESGLAERVLACARRAGVFAATPGLKGFYELARRAALYVGGDTAPTHLAVAAGCPVVGIFGPTEWWRNGSPDPRDLDVGRDDIGCRVGCHRRACDNWICMDIPVGTVFAAVRERLGRVPGAA